MAWERALRNPFRYGEIVTGDHFTNRLPELAALLADIRNGQNVVIVSPRRYGKTSLIFRAVESLSQEGTLIAYVDLFQTPTKDRFAGHLADAIYAGLVAPLERVWQRAVDVFRKLPIQPRITINSDGNPTFEFTSGQQARDIDRTIEGLLQLPQQVAEERERRVALILDEFQEVLSIDPTLPALMRSYFQLQPDVAHVFLGSRRHLMHRVFTDVNQPLYRLAKPMPLRPIAAADFTSFIQERFVSTQQVITEEAVDRILAVAGGHPHDTQELCYFTWTLANEDRVAATPALVDRAVSLVLDAEDARFTTLWEQLSPHQRALLTALSAEEGQLYSEAYRHRHGLGSPSSVQKSVKRLLEREILDFSPPDGYSIADVFLRHWIRRMSTRIAAPNGGPAE